MTLSLSFFGSVHRGEFFEDIHSSPQGDIVPTRHGKVNDRYESASHADMRGRNDSGRQAALQSALLGSQLSLERFDTSLQRVIFVASAGSHLAHRLEFLALHHVHAVEETIGLRMKSS